MIGVWVGLSSAFTQTRLFWPDGVKLLFLMLTYTSTLRQKQEFSLSVQKNAYFANSPNTGHRLRVRSGEFKEGDPTTCF